MTQAARVLDPIGHSPTMNWLIRGAVIGAAIGLGAIAIAGTGGLAAVAIVGGLAAGGAGIGEALSSMSGVAKEVSGMIVGPGSVNVFTNGKPAARAHLDMVMCSKHPPAPLPIATGSATVYINGQPAARVDDTIACSAVITSGSGNVYIGGGSEQTDPISPEDLVPPLVHAAMLVVGVGSAVILAGPIVAVAGLALGTAGGMGGHWAGGKIWGEGSDGQKWSALGGGIVGGLLGGRGGMVLAGKFIPKPMTPTAGFIKGGLPGVKAVGRTSEPTFTYNAIENPGPLASHPGTPAANFFSGKYNATVLTDDLVLYRGGEVGKPLGQWFTREAPESLAQIRIDSAVKSQWIDPKTGVLTGSSPIDVVYAIKFPKGTTVYDGPVGYQGGPYLGGPNTNQVFVATPWNIKGVQVMQSTPIK